MDSSVRKRRSWRSGPGGSHLPAHADSFIKLCDSNELKMRQLVDDLQDISTKLRRLHRRTETCNIVGTVAAAVGLAAAVAAITMEITGGLSLALTAAVAYVAAAAAVVTIRVKLFTTEEERVKKTREVLEIVTVLQSELDNIVELREDQTDDVISLTSNVHRSSVELSDQCQDVFDQFRSTKRKLEELRGRGDAEKIQEEEE